MGGEEAAIHEIGFMSQLITNIDMMQSEAASSLQSLIAKTQELNEEIESQFELFRSKPTKTKNLSEKQKSRIRTVLTQFEQSDDEEQVDLEDIPLGDGKYEKISQFSQNVRKLQKMIKAEQVIDQMKRHSSKDAQSSKVRRPKLTVNQIDGSAPTKRSRPQEGALTPANESSSQSQQITPNTL